MPGQAGGDGVVTSRYVVSVVDRSLIDEKRPIMRSDKSQSADEQEPTMSDIKVLVTGASIAGPALAHWLCRRGAEVLVVEQAPVLRPGGRGREGAGDVPCGRERRRRVHLGD